MQLNSPVSHLKRQQRMRTRESSAHVAAAAVLLYVLIQRLCRPLVALRFIISGAVAAHDMMAHISIDQDLHELTYLPSRLSVHNFTTCILP
jgi:hypothetical protein